MSARKLLGPGGPLSRALPGYEDREGQLDMADAVERALEGERMLICEAGTGTGKTLAYLVPAILSGRKVVVSTATKALEEQIFTKDLPLITRHLGLDPQAALVKGLGNYLCLRRYNELRGSAAAVTDPAIGRSLPLLEAWAGDTESGDVAELTGLAENDPLWREVSSSSETRIGASCKYFDECFVTRMKRDMEAARLIIVNHHLFFADLAVKASMGKAGAPRAGALPVYDAVIFDEAHQLEDIATDFFGTRISRSRVDAMLRDADRAFVSSGLSDRLLSKGEGTAISGIVAEASEVMFGLLVQLAAGGGASASSRDPGDRRRGEPGQPEGKVTLARDVWSGALLGAYHRLDTALEALEGYAEANAVDEAVDLVSQRARQLREDAARIVDPAANQVTWVEARPRSVVIGASPVDLGRMLRERVFNRIGGIVMTSATLATRGAVRAAPPVSPGDDAESERAVPPPAGADFRFFRSRMGLDGACDVPIDELEVASPFDHETRALLYTPSDLPDTNDARFVERAAARVAELVGITGGGAFVLCTSVRSMRALAHKLRGQLATPPLLQGDSPKGALLSRFRAAKHAVLVATMSFWEGVDVPGEALRLVIIDKIPFAVPNDPIVAARCAALEEAGENPFMAYSVPQAAITLKQGFGRLLRTRTDRGIVAILDRRISTRGYGRTLLESLPPAPRTSALADVQSFWARVGPT
jgi:ATP-dependent DNA helicase DinG